MKLLTTILIFVTASVFAQTQPMTFPTIKSLADKEYRDSIVHAKRDAAIEARLTVLENAVTNLTVRTTKVESWQSYFDATSIPLDSIVGKTNDRLDSLVKSNKITDDGQDSKMRQLQDFSSLQSRRLDTNFTVDGNLNRTVSRLNLATNARVDTTNISLVQLSQSTDKKIGDINLTLSRPTSIDADLLAVKAALDALKNYLRATPQ